jgi:hypothetical protein
VVRLFEASTDVLGYEALVSPWALAAALACSRSRFSIATWMMSVSDALSCTRARRLADAVPRRSQEAIPAVGCLRVIRQTYRKLAAEYNGRVELTVQAVFGASVMLLEVEASSSTHPSERSDLMRRPSKKWLLAAVIVGAAILLNVVVFYPSGHVVSRRPTLTYTYSSNARVESVTCTRVNGQVDRAIGAREINSLVRSCR